MSIHQFNFGDGRHVPARIHENGGGVVALSADVDPSVYVSSGCKVWGKAQIRGKVRLVGNVEVFGADLAGGISVLIEDEALIAGCVRITGAVLIRDKAEIRDNVRLSGCVQVLHRARIFGDAVLDGDVQVMEAAFITGKSRIIANGRRIQIRGEHYIDSQCIENATSTGKQRKRRVTSMRPIVLDSIAA